MPEPKIRDRLVGGRRLMGYEVTADGKTDEHDIDQLGTPAATIRGNTCQPPGPR